MNKQSLLPRGHQDNPLRERNHQTNQLLAERLALVERTQLITTDWSSFVQADQTISHLDMYDYLHLTPKGYRKVFGPVHELLLQLFNRIKSEKLSENLLREFVSLTKKFASENFPAIVSLNFAAAKREAG